MFNKYRDNLVIVVGSKASISNYMRMIFFFFFKKNPAKENIYIELG